MTDMPMSPTKPGTRILLVDDDPIFRELATSIVMQIGARPVLADDGVSAWRELNSRKIHLVLADLQMPNLDGYRLIEGIRSQSRWRHLPIVVASSLSEPEEIRKAIELGATSYLVKPMDWPVLGGCLRQTLKATSPETRHLLKGQREKAAARLALPPFWIKPRADLQNSADGVPRTTNHLVSVQSLLSVAIARINKISIAKNVPVCIVRTADTSIFCDADQLVAALVRVIGNAIAFSASGQIVTVDAHIHNDEAAIISVADTGQGISANLVEYCQFGNPAECIGTQVEGVDVVSATVRNHGGAMEIQSRLRWGTTVTFRLPVVSAAGNYQTDHKMPTVEKVYGSIAP